MASVIVRPMHQAKPSGILSQALPALGLLLRLAR
jgi:hypothetical protein